MFVSYFRSLCVRLRVAVWALALAMVASAAFAQAEKQQYVSAPVKLPRDQVGKAKLAFETALRNPAGFGAAEAGVNTYLKSYFFPVMTQTSPADLGALADSRKKLLAQYIPQAANASSQQFLIDQTFNFARVMARGNFHPAVRYNAVLILGELYQQLGGGANPPVPHAKATQELLELVEQEQFNKIPVPESVKLGALIGLGRHSRLGIDPALKDRLTKAMIAVMASPTPEDVEPDVHDWVRSTAALVLANQFANAPTKEVQTALTNLIADKKVGLDDRSVAAGALGRIKYAAGADIDGDATVAALAQLTMDVISEASKLAEEFTQEAVRGADFSAMGERRYGGGGGRGGYGGYGDEEEQRPRFERRQLFARLHSIASGGAALKEALSEESKSRIGALIGELGPLVQIMEDKNSTEVGAAEEVIIVNDSLESLVKEWGLAGATADQAKPATGFAGK